MQAILDQAGLAGWLESARDAGTQQPPRRPTEPRLSLRHGSTQRLSQKADDPRSVSDRPFVCHLAASRAYLGLFARPSRSAQVEESLQSRVFKVRPLAQASHGDLTPSFAVVCCRLNGVG
jgi:hypothetical protein